MAEGMTNTATFRRTAVALCLLLTGVLSALSNALAPAFPSDAAERLAAFADAGTRAWVSALSFAFAQLPFIVAMLGLGHLLRTAAPRLANLGTSVAVVGGFGHAVFAGVSLTVLSLAQDAEHRDVLAAAVDDLESRPLMVFAVLGLLGTVLGLVLVAVGLWRAQVGPRWVPAALGLFLVVEFVGTALSEWAAPASGLLYLLAFAALARHVAGTDAQAWQTVDEHRGVVHV